MTDKEKHRYEKIHTDAFYFITQELETLTLREFHQLLVPLHRK